MNELIFFTHLAAVVLFSQVTRRIGAAALICFVVLQSLFANIFVLKQMILFGYEVTCSDVYAVGAIISLNFLQERYSKESARKAVYYSFFFLLFFVAMSYVHLLYQPSQHDRSHVAYEAIFSPVPRLIFASIVTTFISQSFDVNLFSFVSKNFVTASFIVRSGISTLFSQAVDTLLFTYIGLWGLVEKPWDVFIISYMVKLGISFFLLIFSSNHEYAKESA